MSRLLPALHSIRSMGALSDSAASDARYGAASGIRDGASLRERGRLVAVLHSRLWLWCAFALVHLAIAAAVLSFDGFHLGDVHTHYLRWATAAVTGDHRLVGIDTRWVYPVGALVPVLLPILFGTAAYGAAWVAMVTVLNAGALAVLTRRRIRPRWIAAWWWLAFLLLLGPIALVRLDTVSVPIAIVALVWLATRPRTAVVLLTIATWIKVWPVALLASLLLDARHRIRTIAIAIATSAAIVAVPLALGAGRNLLSFVGMQDARGLQIESPVATWWLWASALHVGPSHVFHSRALSTWEVSGPGSAVAVQLMTPLLVVALVVVMVLGVLLAVRHDEKSLPTLMLAMVLTLVLFDKVLSPQYVAWLAAPIAYGLMVRPRHFRLPALMALGVAALTQSFFPWIYPLLVNADPLVVTLLTLRNLALVALFVWTIVTLCRTRSTIADVSARSIAVGAARPVEAQGL